MKKRLASLLFIIIVLVLSVTGCREKEQKEKTKEKSYEDDGVALIWEVKSKTSTLYLVGSIHVGTEDMYPLKSVLLDAFNDSEILAVEADIVEFESDIKTMTELSYMMTYTDGTTIKDHISEETFNLLENYLDAKGIPGVLKGYEYYYLPFVLASAIEQQYYNNGLYKSEYGVDTYFLKQAKERNMNVVEIESVMQQYEMMVNFSDELQDLLLKSSLQATEETTLASISIMLKAWIKGDHDLFQKYLDLQDSISTKTMIEKERLLYEEYNEKLLYDRNFVMTNKIEELLKDDKNVFYVVGSAHLFGDKGIIKLLENKGYTVTKKIG